MAGSKKNKSGSNKHHVPAKPKVQSSVHAEKSKKSLNQSGVKGEPTGLSSVQQQYGNRAAQQAVQRKGGDAAYKLSGNTSKEISREKGGGHQIEGVVQQKLSKSLGYDLSDIRIHTGKTADSLNRKVNAKAFTVGKDIFFRNQEYSPNARSGQELLAHEVTHVVDQSKGKVRSSGSGMTVHAPNDTHEQRADRVAAQVVDGVDGPAAKHAYVPGKGMESKNLQRANEEEVEMKSLQREGEEEVEMKSLQREGEEEVEMKSLQREGEEEVEMKSLQREGEEEVEMKSLQREGEEEVEMKSLQREGEEEVEMKSLQREGEEEVEMKSKKS